ncbi:GNAT family N-acetyltransferase [Mycoplasma sp. ES3225-GEN-MYC]|uniref:GNAT family N-acetyltransferase n=1 Tax=Mycoplasma miroungigenitalium TaxID=754515 RepID=A0A6M4JCL3_9MOLU|nr:GNAT family N-acetyltransferase [Mycoplasma miroungigenitalium]MBU4691920.1 GNAT family N-acetyltransferase [Mycoplasma miroungigenitalium]QJR43776.1 GNAT family N-acetyltransferase [Mycoplasma miroungigenitalium]
MIIKATEAQKNIILDFLDKDVDNNFFFIGDIENFGLHSKIHSTYVKLSPDNEIVAVLLIFNNTLLFYDPFSQLHWNEIIEIVNKNKLININISENMYKRFSDNFNSKRFNVHKQYLARLNSFVNLDTSRAIEATKEDIKLIVESRLKIPEFTEFTSDFVNEYNSYLESYESGVSHPFIIKSSSGKVVSCATIAINASNKSVIGGVYTLPEFRQSGLASIVVAALSNWILSRGNQPILFYHNPEAGKIYHSLGYKDVGILYTIVINDIKEKNV